MSKSNKATKSKWRFRFWNPLISFEKRKEPDYMEYGACEHGRIEVRKIWTTTELNDYLNFPYIAQAFVIEREFTNKKSGKDSKDITYGITSRTPDQTDPKRVIEINRGHWSIESCHYIIDWNYDEDRSRINQLCRMGL